jgi:hypothetical protein
MSMLQRCVCVTIVFSYAGRAFAAQLIRTADDPSLIEHPEMFDDVPRGTVRVAVDATGDAAATPTKVAPLHQDNMTDLHNLVSMQLQNAKHGCKEGMLACDTYRCLSRLNVCDGVSDCYDGTDEKLCLSQTASTARRGRLSKYEAGESTPDAPQEVSAETNSTSQTRFLGDRPPYLLVKVDGLVPPEKDAYADFYDKFEVDPVDHLPRIDESKENLDIEVFYLANLISDPFMASFSIQHTGIGYKVYRRNDDGHKDEVFRIDTQYWAASFPGTFGPARTAEDRVILNERNQMTWRNRAIVTASKTHYKWHPDWKGGEFVKLGHINPKEFNRAMDWAENYAKVHTFFQQYEIVKDDHVVVPSSNCESFTQGLTKEVFNIDLLANKQVPVWSNVYTVESYKTLNVLKEPDEVNRPHHEDVMGFLSFFESEFTHHVQEHVLNYAQLRQFIRFQEHKPWTIPLWYGEDGKPFERSETPTYYISFMGDSIRAAKNGKTLDKRWIGRPKMPRIGDLARFPSGAKDAMHAAGKAGGALGELPPSVVAPLSNIVGTAALTSVGAGHALGDAAHQAGMPRTMQKLGNQLTEDLSSLNLGHLDKNAEKLGKTAEKFFTEHADTAHKIRDAVTATASDMLADFEESTDKLEKFNTNKFKNEESKHAYHEAMRLRQIVGANLDKLNHEVSDMNPLDAVKAMEKALTSNEVKTMEKAFVDTQPKKDHHAPHRPTHEKEKAPRKSWPLMR